MKGEILALLVFLCTACGAQVNLLCQEPSSNDSGDLIQRIERFIKCWNIGSNFKNETTSTDGPTTWPPTEEVSTDGPTTWPPTEEVSTDGPTTWPPTEEVSTDGPTTWPPTEEVSTDGSIIETSSEKSTPWSTMEPTTITTTDSSLPECNLSTSSVLPHPSNCSLFYSCSNGDLVLKECPSGLLFNPTIKVCDWPHNVKCGNVSSAPLRSCPAQDEHGKTVRIPHETNCNYYYVCNSGTPHLYRCPNGWHLSPTQRVCRTPNEAMCLPKTSIS